MPPAIIPCSLLPEVKTAIEQYAESLKSEAHSIGNHGLTESDFWDSGIFRSAIERLRGIQAASMQEKKAFMELVLNFLLASGKVSKWEFKGTGERYDYEVIMADRKVCAIETKGCLDGNNTNIFERPPNADEFIIWSLCQNAGADPRHNVWSGIHTRLGAEVISRQQVIDGVVIWDMVCGTKGKPCPKLKADPSRATDIGGKIVPPPCIYLFPRSVPDPRNNPKPPSWDLNQVSILNVLNQTFKGQADDVVEVKIECRMEKANVQRKTHFIHCGDEMAASKWTTIKRVR